MSVQVVGLDKLLDTFKRLAARVSDKQTGERVLRRAAEPVRAAMEQRAPRSDTPPHIADNIVIEPIAPSDKQSAAVTVGPREGFAYGAYLEFGTAFMAAQPFVRPALDGEAERAVDSASRDFWNEIDG